MRNHTVNQKQAALTVIGGAITVSAVATVANDWLRSKGGAIRCDGDERRLIDIRGFHTACTSYCVEIDAPLRDKRKLGGKLEPKQLQSMSEALQQANEFRKYLVSRIIDSLKKSRRESLPYGVANARKPSRLAALCSLSDSDCYAFLLRALLHTQILI